MKFEAKSYKRLGTMVGSIIGVWLMIIAVCLYRTAVGAVLLIGCTCIGIVSGNMMEKKAAEETESL